MRLPQGFKRWPAPRLTTMALLVLFAFLGPHLGVAETLPLPQPPFKGKIGKTYKDSVPDFPKPIKAPKGAPNVLLIMLDDVGFGQAGTFGGPGPINICNNHSWALGLPIIYEKFS
jgi:hypothetical protein